jgi:phosphoglycolate phosphatase-like HAD superfamily hydrolase
MESNTDKALEAVKQGAGTAASYAGTTAAKVATVVRAKVAELAAIPPSASADDHLHSWNDTPTRAAIVGFVESGTKEGGSDYLAPPDRIAVFDNDGTLWTEKPMPIQLDFTIRRWAEQTEADASLREKQPWKAAYEHDLHWFGAAVVKHYHGDDSDLELLQDGMNKAFDKVSIEDYRRAVDAFFAEAQHPTLQRPYLKCAYQPMCELLDYLAANGFTNYIASGGDRDFMRGMAEDLYGIPPERVIGSTQALEYHEGEGGVDVLYKSEVEIFDDGPVKPTRIWSRIGRRPVIAGGNSNGDIPMLRFARVESRPYLRLLVKHDDAEREFDDVKGAEAALERAAQQGWTVISIKDDWNTVFVS